MVVSRQSVSKHGSRGLEQWLFDEIQAREGHKRDGRRKREKSASLLYSSLRAGPSTAVKAKLTLSGPCSTMKMCAREK
jgi:hypothetical protein